jgi:hypothetical protein
VVERWPQQNILYAHSVRWIFSNACTISVGRQRVRDRSHIIGTSSAECGQLFDSVARRRWPNGGLPGDAFGRRLWGECVHVSCVYILQTTATNDQSKSRRPTACFFSNPHAAPAAFFNDAGLILLRPFIGSRPRACGTYGYGANFSTWKSNALNRSVHPLPGAAKDKKKVAGKKVLALGGNFLMEWVLRRWKVPKGGFCTSRRAKCSRWS